MPLMAHLPAPRQLRPLALRGQLPARPVARRRLGRVARVLPEALFQILDPLLQADHQRPQLRVLLPQRGVLSAQRRVLSPKLRDLLGHAHARYGTLVGALRQAPACSPPERLLLSSQRHCSQ